MSLQRFAVLLYVVGVLVMAGDVWIGKTIQPEVTALGLSGIEARDGERGLGKILLFAFSYPLGVALCLMGAALRVNTASNTLGKLVGFALLVLIVPLLSPAVLGKQHSPQYFGLGGITLLGLTALSLWYWGKFRARVSAALRPAVDWQGLGIFAFALAAWNLCGVGGMPGFALYPEQVLKLQSLPFAVPQLKAVMALLILGFLFTALGLRRAAMAVR
jgi:hypothetical protein